MVFLDGLLWLFPIIVLGPPDLGVSQILAYLSGVDCSTGTTTTQGFGKESARYLSHPNESLPQPLQLATPHNLLGTGSTCSLPGSPLDRDFRHVGWPLSHPSCIEGLGTTGVDSSSPQSENGDTVSAAVTWWRLIRVT